MTLPPFMQKAAADGLAQAYTPAAAKEMAARDKDPNGKFYALVNNYSNFIYDSSALKQAPQSYDDLLKADFKGKIICMLPLAT